MLGPGSGLVHSCRTLQQTQPLSVSMISSSLWKALPRRINGGGLVNGSRKRAAAVGCSVLAVVAGRAAGVQRDGDRRGGGGGGGDLFFAMSLSSIEVSPNSFSMMAIFLPCVAVRMWLSSVVLPEPRKPVRMVTGTRSILAPVRTPVQRQYSLDEGVKTRGTSCE